MIIYASAKEKFPLLPARAIGGYQRALEGVKKGKPENLVSPEHCMVNVVQLVYIYEEHYEQRATNEYRLQYT
jgi:hypothetical protein